ncbi:MAG: amidohydrolase family protein [Firmicutes bacterium]|nr:amidohydrolase family protein [Bacillota bacterium]
MREGDGGGTLDLLVRDVRAVSVLTGEAVPADIAVARGRIVSLRPLGGGVEARRVVDGGGRYALPGFVDAHMHIESSFLTPAAFAPAALARGTTTVAADPHEIANVAGEAGVRAMLRASRGLPLSVFFLVPSCVPSVPGLETSGGEIGAAEVARLLRHPRVLGLGEVMDYRGVVTGDARIAAILARARRAGRRVRVEGHAPHLVGEDLERFMAAGVVTDHTDNSDAAWLEKMRLGMFAELQAKSIRPSLIAAMASLPLLPPFALVTDDVATDTLVAEGHLDRVARLAVAAGLPPLAAVRAMTLWPALHLGLTDRGRLSPGLRADMVLCDDLASLAPSLVVAGGQVVARDGRPTLPPRPAAPVWDAFRHSLRLAPGRRSFAPAEFAWRVPGPPGRRRMPAMAWRPTDNRTAAAEVVLDVGADGEVHWPGHASLVRVIERYSGREGSASAPLLGLSWQDAAVATTYAHDSHNLLVVGSSPAAMAAAATAVLETGGGIAVARGERVLARLPLPLAGIMSDAGADAVAAAAAEVRRAMEAVGYRHANPFMSVATLSLLVSLERKLSDRGLVDVDRRAFTPEPYGRPL